MTRLHRSTLLLLGSAALLSACASHRGGGAARLEEAPTVTPTERYAIQVRETPEEAVIMASAHGLSPQQTAALADLAERWREGDGGAVTVRCPSAGGEVAKTTAALVADALNRYGVPAEMIRVTNYPGAAGAPILAGFLRLEAVGPQCADKWSEFTHTRANVAHLNFGCSTTANMAAQIANPRELVALRPMDPADATRRSVVLGKYRNGETTASERAAQEKGTVSEAVD